jgi:hypothetical protein
MKQRSSTRGGKRPGAGRGYRPWTRIWLANRYAELKLEFEEAGVSKPGHEALVALHLDEHADGAGSIATTRRSIASGRIDEIVMGELDAKRHNKEPLSDDERSVLRKLTRRSARRHR